ncbi:MAG: carbonic anhydrase [Patescibacteria group bacterium]
MENNKTFAPLEVNNPKGGHKQNKPLTGFACAINCMDGRVQDAVKNYIKENYSVDYVDMATEPGPNKILAENTDAVVIENIKKRVDISVNHHNSKVIAIVGHFGCAGNPVEKKEQIEHLKKARKTVESFGFPAEIILLWVDGDWETVEKIILHGR